MRLFHTCPSITDETFCPGHAGSFLLFTATSPSMTDTEGQQHSIQIDVDSIIDASRLFYSDSAAKLAPLVLELASTLSIDENDAMALMEGSKSISNIDGIEGDPEAVSRTVNEATAKASALLGFKAVAIKQNNMTCYLVDTSADDRARL